MELVTSVQILHEVFCISLYTDVLEKDMKPSVLPSAMSRVDRILYSWYGNQSKRKKTLNSNQHYSA